ncbi:MAG: 50S ribosomal protein L23 [Candidatus Firestonebacteria bacterium]
METYQVIKKPLLTEKAVGLKEKENKYMFAVNIKANKSEIKNAVEKLFNVKVMTVNTLKMHGKARVLGRYPGKRQDWKKAYVTLRKDDKIQDMEA